MVFRLRTTAQAAGDSLIQSEGYVNKVTVATYGDQIPFSGPCASGDHHHVWILAPDGKNALGPGLSKINMAASLPQSRCASVIAVGAADVDPSQPVWRPRSAPAAVVGGIGVGHTNTNERKAMMAVMEESAVMGKSCMRKTRTGEAATCEPDPAASEADAAACETHAAGTHAAAHATKMHSTSTSMHAATTMTATAAMAAATTTAGEHG
jgi:hypothetical protein